MMVLIECSDMSKAIILHIKSVAEKKSCGCTLASSNSIPDHRARVAHPCLYVRILVS